jgi:lysyl-tRNA synthetase class 2
MLTKALRPLPEKWHGLKDPDLQQRRRYLHLATDLEARRPALARAALLRSLRSELDGRGFVEVETPVLQPVAGGANARPFTTHHNALDMDLKLRISLELYLKRLTVGGLERVYEIGRIFRNEGIDRDHNPEFTMLEAYQAYADYDTMLTLTREMIQAAATAAYGSPVAHRTDVDGSVSEVDLSGQWPVRTVNEAISAALGECVDNDTTVERLVKLCEAADISHHPSWGRGALILEIYEHLVEARTHQPTFYKDFPTEVSPLTRQHRADPRMAERWDLVAFGAEIGTAYSELVDPVEQRERLTAQSLLAAKGDPEAMELDEEFLTALEYAMPPTGGLGMGVDRLIMMLTGRTIRDTVIFPIVRPQG